MKRTYFLMTGCLALLAACATVGSPDTPGQKVYAALSVYEVATHAAAEYAVSPTANPTVVKAMDSVVSSSEARTATDFAKTYVSCQSVSTDAKCKLYNFSGSNLVKYSLILSSLANQLLRKQ